MLSKVEAARSLSKFYGGFNSQSWILGENILDSHCSYAGLGRMTSQDLIFSKQKLILTANPFFLTDLKLSVSIRASFREVITVKQIPLCREVSNTWLSQPCQDVGLIPSPGQGLSSQALHFAPFLSSIPTTNTFTPEFSFAQLSLGSGLGFFFPHSFICFCLGKLRKQKG